MTEDELAEAAGLVARFYFGPRRGMSYDERFAIQLRLIKLGVQLTNPLSAPDPRAPPGGSAQAIKAA